jgi:alkylation response protein AidB-like acyl-CoA dehydrogenase
VGKRLLQHERSGQGGGRLMGGGKPLPQIAAAYADDEELGAEDLRGRIVAQAVDARAHTLTMKRAAEESRGNQNPSAATSVMKNSGTRIGQDKAELTLEAMGAQGLGWEGESFADEELTAVRAWLFGKATTIFGGSAEIQNNIISKRILGLPDPIGGAKGPEKGIA